MKKDLEKLEKENLFLRTILDDLAEGIYAVTAKGEIIVYNKAMEGLENTDRRYVLGYSDSEIYNIFPEEQHLAKEVLETGKPIKNRRLVYQMATGYQVNMITDAYPFLNEAGEIESVYFIMNDISNVSRLQERIATLNSLLCRESDQWKAAARQNGTQYTFDDILGDSQEMRDVVKQARQIAGSMSNVLIYGETGTGKELFAQSIHNAGRQKDGPFIAINCAAIPSTLLESQLFGTVPGAFSDAKNMPGFFEQAENGTLFLDEINSMDLNLQAKLLRILQDKTVCRLGDKTPKQINCRVICATNQDPLDAEVRKNFREDLLYRLMTIVLFLPPLRNHMSDVPLLSKHYLSVLNQRYDTHILQIDNDLMKVIMNFSWPGNTRQFVNFLESCICYVDPRSTTLTVDHVPTYMHQQFSIRKFYFDSTKKDGTLNDLLNDFEKELILKRIGDFNGNISQAAKSLGISRQNMNYKLNKLGLHGVGRKE